MRRKMLVGLALAVCGAVAFTATSLASGKAAKPRWKSETLVVYNYNTSLVAVDTDNSGSTDFDKLTPGDLLISTDDVYDKPKTDGGKKIGHTEGGVCVIITDIQGAGNCTGAFAFADGRIFFSGDVSTGFAVTGGTGAYRNVRGEAAVELAPDFSYAKDTLKLIGVDR